MSLLKWAHKKYMQQMVQVRDNNNDAILEEAERIMVMTVEWYWCFHSSQNFFYSHATILLLFRWFLMVKIHQRVNINCYINKFVTAHGKTRLKLRRNLQFCAMPIWRWSFCFISCLNKIGQMHDNKNNKTCFEKMQFCFLIFFPCCFHIDQFC